MKGYYRMTMSKRNALGMVDAYNQELKRTPRWKIFTRLKLKRVIKLWEKMYENDKNRV